MSQRSVIRMLAVACVGLMFGFMAETVEAQRRGGGGRGGGGRGGGGRSISRSRTGERRLVPPERRLEQIAREHGAACGHRVDAAVHAVPSTRPSTPRRIDAAIDRSPARGAATPAGRGGPARARHESDRATGRTGPGRPAGRLGDNANREDWQQHREDMRERIARTRRTRRARTGRTSTRRTAAATTTAATTADYAVRVVDYDEDDDDWRRARGHHGRHCARPPRSARCRHNTSVHAQRSDRERRDATSSADRPGTTA